MVSLFILFFILSGKIKFEVYEYDFGKINEGEEVTYVFKFKNIGNDTLFINDVRASCGCTSTLLTEKVIPPNGNGEIKATFRTQGYKGKQEKIIYVNIKDTINPQIKLKLKGIVVPKIKFYLFSKEKKLPDIMEKYNTEAKFMNLIDEKNVEILNKFKKKYGIMKDEEAIVICDTIIFSSEFDKLEEILKRYEEKGCELQSYSTHSVYVAYFYRGKNDKKFRESLQNKYSYLTLDGFDFSLQENKNLYIKLCEIYNVPKEKRYKFPIAFVGDVFLVQKEINDKLSEIIEKYELVGTKKYW